MRCCPLSSLCCHSIYVLAETGFVLPALLSCLLVFTAILSSVSTCFSRAGDCFTFYITEGHYPKYSILFVFAKQTGLLKPKIFLVYSPSVPVLLGASSAVELSCFTPVASRKFNFVPCTFVMQGLVMLLQHLNCLVFSCLGAHG